MYAIIGLGNPTKQYELTRHNVGFMFADYIAKSYSIELKKLKFKALTGEGIIQGKKVIIAKPQTYMNLSGECVREIKDFYKLNNEQIIIIYDDISLELGRLRIRKKGSDGGHNGIKNIIYHLNSDIFSRIKVGIKPKEDMHLVIKDFVLGNFQQEELQTVAKKAQTALKAIELILADSIEAAMNNVNC